MSTRSTVSTIPPPPATGLTSFFHIDALFNNPLFAGGIGLASLGAAAALARRTAIRGAALVKRRLLVNLEISKQDQAYPWILEWLSLQQPPVGFIATKLTRVHDLSMKTVHRSAQNRPSEAQFLLLTGYGTHIIHHNNAYIQVNRQKHTTAMTTTGEPHETVTFTTLYAYRHIFKDIFAEAHRLATSAHEGKIVVYASSATEWKLLGEPRKKRPLNSVVLDKGIKERIMEDVKDFINKQQWYTDRGIPYRRGYLLYGPPGSGKTSFIQAMAGELDFGISIINLNERGMTDDRLAVLLRKLPLRTILLLEDADAAYTNRRKPGADGYNGATVTFSGLLNALDGVAAGEERIVFLTTNHIDRLDEALIRPGRVDMTVRIGEATRYQAAEMWNKFYGDIDLDGNYRNQFMKRLVELGLLAEEGQTKQTKLHTNTAAIQGLFIFNKGDMEGAIAMADALIPRTYEPETPEAIKVAA